MIRLVFVFYLAALLTGCSAYAPRPPIGFARHPANPPGFVADGAEKALTAPVSPPTTDNRPVAGQAKHRHAEIRVMEAHYDQA